MSQEDSKLCLEDIMKETNIDLKPEFSHNKILEAVKEDIDDFKSLETTRKNSAKKSILIQ